MYCKDIETVKGDVGNREYIQIKNIHTGELAMIDKSTSRYKRIALGFLNSLKITPKFLKHIILTQSKESYQPKHINNFMSAMRKRYGPLLYVWTVEVQEERLEKYGDAVLHWHLIIGFDTDIEDSFDREDIRKIQSFWKFGDMRNSVEIRRVNRPSISYLMKYMQKALSTSLSSEYQIKRISSSRISGWLKQSWTSICRAIDYLIPRGCGMELWDQFVWQNGNAYGLVFDSYFINGKEYTHRVKIPIYKRAPSEWYKTIKFEGDPF